MEKNMSGAVNEHPGKGASLSLPLSLLSSSSDPLTYTSLPVPLFLSVIPFSVPLSLTPTSPSLFQREKRQGIRCPCRNRIALLASGFCTSGWGREKR